MLEAVADPNQPNHAEAKEWLDEYDPKVIGRTAHQIRPQPHRANRRNAANTRLANNKQTPSTSCCCDYSRWPSLMVISHGRVIVCESLLLGSEAVADGLSDSANMAADPKSSAMT